MTGLASRVLLIGVEGTQLSLTEKNYIKKSQPAGLVLFRRNLSPLFATVKNLVSEYTSLCSGFKPLVSIDQEGGRVARFGFPFPNLGPAANLAPGKEDGDARVEIENYGYVVGACLKSLGINTNFAPVCDIAINPQNQVIGDRAFGTDATSVSKRAGAYLQGLQNAGVLGCLKHFPGQGAGYFDTHHQGDQIDESYETLLERELVPFKDLLPKCPMVMMSHSAYPQIDPLPASISKVMIQKILKGDLGFKGLVLSDDFNMKAIGQDEKAFGDAVLAAFAAGTDLLLVCQSFDHCAYAAQAVEREMKKSPAFAARIQDAAQRISKVI
ncbi:MAG: beta-N-acetylhexosaminidase [Oligoflexales bacterium]